MMNVYLIHKLYSNGVENWSDVVEAFKDKNEAQLRVIEMNEVLGYVNDGGDSCEFYLQEMELK